jgi:hypothetical protein
VLLGIYLGGYVLARRSHEIVHRTSVAGDRYSGHSMEAGDAKFGGAIVNDMVALIYTPLRYAEAVYWRLHQPVDSPLSEAERQRRSP